MFNDLSLSHLTIWQCFFGTGIALMLLELCIPAFFLLWIGIACLFTAATLAMWVFGPMGQMLCFFGFSTISLIVGYFVYERKSTHQHSSSALNKGSEQLVGQILTLEESFGSNNADHTKYYVNVNDTRWVVRCVDGAVLVEGKRVRVISIKGNTLMVSLI
ncbi:MAG: NfeD family protein [Pseudomonadota bacterium]